jgi:threonine dehydratase
MRAFRSILSLGAIFSSAATGSGEILEPSPMRAEAEQLPQGLTSERILEASAFLAGRVRRTPLEESPALSERTGVPTHLKLESLQTTGSFKLRGAWFAISRLGPAARRAGIATCSAGNHGKAVAFAARQAGIPARIYVPRDVDESKHRAMLALGAEVLRSEFVGYDETQDWALRETARDGRFFLSAYDDDDVMAGNGGSLALEVLEDAPDARSFLLPVGGGGLSAGFGFWVKERRPESLLVGCQHERSPALALSLERGRAVTRLPAVETAAGGLEGGIGERTFEVLRTRVDRVALLSEEEILDAVRWMLEEHQYLIEPSAAVTVAACRTGRCGTLEGPAVVVLSGRNVSLRTLRRILA